MLNFLFNKFYGISIKLNSIFCLNLSFKLFNKPLSVSKAEDHYKISSQKEVVYMPQLERIYIYLDTYVGVRTRLDNLFDQYFLDYIQFNENDIVVDCGAHLGELSYFFDDKKVIYYAFEPSSRLQKCLEKNIRLNIKDYQIINKPLLDVEQKLKLYLRDESGDTSIEADSKAPFEYVESLRLDSFFEKNSKIKLLKIDAEGYELEMIKGTFNLLKDIEYISIDAGYERNNETESPFLDVDKFLTENNFKILKSHEARKTFLYHNSSLSA